MADSLKCDFLIVGAGIAGASAAYALAAHGSVIMIEMEDRPGYHTTGRSAAFFLDSYGPAPVRALTGASRPFLESPPDGFSDAPLMKPRGALHLARPGEDDALQQLIDKIPDHKARLGIDEASAMVPVLRAGRFDGAVLESDCRTLDVAALHQGYLAGMRRRGGRLLTDAPLRGLERTGAHWSAEAGEARIKADVVIDAAGAWGDEVAAMAGAAPLRLTPLRRTIVIAEVQDDDDDDPFTAPADWPIVLDVAETFYFLPEGRGLLLSPTDETPSPPCDARPEELDIALAVDRFETATTLNVRRVVTSWAGLRTFTPDRVHAIGFDDRVPGFFWCVGQGGFGIMTSPAAGQLAAALAVGGALSTPLAEAGIDPAWYAPARLFAETG